MVLQVKEVIDSTDFGKRYVTVRVNMLGSAWWTDDLAVMATCPRVSQASRQGRRAHGRTDGSCFLSCVILCPSVCVCLRTSAIAQVDAIIIPKVRVAVERPRRRREQQVPAGCC